MTTTSCDMLYDTDQESSPGRGGYPPSTNLISNTGLSGVAASRQYQTAQRLRNAIGANKVWACDRCNADNAMKPRGNKDDLVSKPGSSFAACYRLKIKCDSIKPACSACTKHDLEHSCTYGGTERTNGSSRRGRRFDTVTTGATAPSYVRMLEARVREVEGLLQQDKKLPGSDHRYPSDYEGHAESSRSLDSWTGIPHAPSYTSGGVQHPGYQQSPEAIAHSFPNEGFSPELQYELCRVFFDDIVPLMYAPPFHERTFFPKMFLECQDHSEFLVTTMCALAAPYSQHPALRDFLAVNQLPTYCAGEAYYERARSMVDELTANPSVDLVVGLFWLSGACSQMGKDASIKQDYLRLALTLCIKLRLNVDPDVEEVHGVLPWLAKEVRRRVWWTLCSLDIINSLPNADRAPSISDRDHPVTDRTPCLHGWRQTPRAPAPEALFQSVLVEDGLPRMSAFVPGVDFDTAERMVSLTKLYGHIKVLRGTAWSMAKRANSKNPVEARAKESVIAARRASCAHLEGELVAWFTSLPDWVQSIDRATQFARSPTSQNPPSWQLVCLHLFYHAAHISLHLPTMLDSEAATSPLSPEENSAEDADVANAYTICLQHTQRASFLLTKVRDLNPRGQFLGPWAPLFAFYSALVLVITLKTTPHGRYRDDVRADLDAHIHLIQSLASKWFTASRTLMILMNIIAEDEEDYRPASVGPHPSAREGGIAVQM
ncbi:hypothetical protein HKX48_001045 [Thoreauomyces humboldtii]|nr:hypothetical protein HKX48_001045 [Thoreauomyces humboldtii]